VKYLFLFDEKCVLQTEAASWNKAIIDFIVYSCAFTSVICLSEKGLFCFEAAALCHHHVAGAANGIFITYFIPSDFKLLGQSRDRKYTRGVEYIWNKALYKNVFINSY